MVKDERIQIPHNAVGWGESCSAKLGVHRQVPVSQEYWRKRIGPSLADRSRVELALLPRLSLTRLSRTPSLFLFRGSFVLHSLAITRRERSNRGAYYHIERSEA
ncbi:hypothetical protein MLD38_040519 [Melastoma candidum]|nr:hypothetical protein MLD38_040519 [Melastoma candidum]